MRIRVPDRICSRYPRQQRQGSALLSVISPGNLLLRAVSEHRSAAIGLAAIACMMLSAPFAFGQHMEPKNQPAKKSADHGPTIVFTSPRTGADEGYATDGTHQYFFSANKIWKAGPDWKPVQTNAKPFTGLPAGVNHVGDGAYYGDDLYAPVEYWHSCQTVAHQTIAIYNATAAGLPLVRHKDISANGQEIASIAIVPSQDALYTASFCNGAKLMIYNLKTLDLKGTLPLSRNIKRIQGISWNPVRKEFAMTADSRHSTDGSVYLVSPKGRVTGPIYTTSPVKGHPMFSELEGVDYTQNTIRFLIHARVYYLKP